MNAKRAFDLIVTLTAAIAWVPAMLLTALLILILEGRPIFYMSRRVTSPGRATRVPKFRTMIRNAELHYNRNVVPVSDGVRFLNMAPDSPLYTPIGRIVERIAFTELPQLFLVLKGDMSLVGNRPLPQNVMDSLAEAYGDVDGRLASPCGLTGPVQLIGRERVTDGQRLELERTYCRVVRDGRTWKMDFLILLYTVLEALRLRHPMTYGEVREFILSHGSPASATEALLDVEDDAARSQND